MKWILCALCIATAVLAQVPDSLWMMNYGLPNVTETGNKIVVMPDSGYMVFGSKYVNGTTFPWLVRFDPYGDTLWSRTWDSLSGLIVEEVLLTDNSELLVVGSRYTSNARYRIWLARFNSSGMPLRIVSYGDTNSWQCLDVYPTSDGNFVGAGLISLNSYSNSRQLALKFTPLLDTLWSRTYGETYYRNRLNSVCELPSGELMFVGATSLPQDYYDLPFMLRTSSSGLPIWSGTITEGYEAYLSFRSVFARPDGSYLIVSAYRYESTSIGSRLMDARNQLVQRRNMYFPGGYLTVNSVVETPDRTVLLAGSQQRGGANRSDFWVAALNGNGDSLWSKTLGTSHMEYANSIAALSDHNFVLTGNDQPVYGGQNSELTIFRSGARAIDFNPTIVNFGQRSVGRARVLDIQAENNFDHGVRVVYAIMPQGFTLQTHLPVWISPHSAINLQFSFLPQVLGEYSGRIDLRIDEPQRWARINVSGVGISGPEESWRREYGETLFAEECNAVAALDDGEFVVAGTRLVSESSIPDLWVIRCDRAGDSLWSYTYSGVNADVANDVISTEDGGFAVLGYTNSQSAGSSDFLLLKFSASNSLEFSRTYGGQASDRGQALVQCADGGYALAGSTVSYGAGGQDFWLLRLDEFGDTLWTKTFGGAFYEGCQGGNSHDGCEDLLVTRDGGLVLAGWTSSFQGQMADGLIIKVSQLGDSVWNYTVGDDGHDSLFAAAELPDGQLTFAGYSRPTLSASRDFWRIGTLESGEISWSHTYGGPADEECRAITILPSEEILYSGFTTNGEHGGMDALLIKASPWGDIVWSNHIGWDGAEKFNGVTTLTDQGLVLAGSSTSSGEHANDFWLVKLIPDCVLTVAKPNPPTPSDHHFISNYPNPFNAATTIVYEIPVAGEITLSIYNLNGAVIESQSFENKPVGRHEYTFDGSAFGSGLYFARIQSDRFAATTKMILLK